MLLVSRLHRHATNNIQKHVKYMDLDSDRCFLVVKIRTLTEADVGVTTDLCFGQIF